MIAEVLLMATTVWYVPGWMRAETPQEGVIPALEETFPKDAVSFWSWDGNKAVWPLAVESADKEAWRLAFEIATLPPGEREQLVLVGHSLGARIIARTLAHLAEKGVRVRGAVLMAAAIPRDDKDLGRMGAASASPVLSLCNPDDVTLRYVYATVGGEHEAAFGAGNSSTALTNVVAHVVPSNITKRVAIDRRWGKSQVLKDIANHHALFYVGYLKEILKGKPESGR